MKLSAGIAAVAVGLGATATHAAEVTRAPFGTTPDGIAVETVTLTSRGITARIITYGATLQSLLVPDRMGRAADVALGYDDLAGYVAKPQFFGATVGRYANRIAGRQVHARRQGVFAGRQQRPERAARRHEGLRQVVWTAIAEVKSGPPSRRDADVHEPATARRAIPARCKRSVDVHARRPPRL